MKNLKKITRGELKKVNGGKQLAFACYCGSKYMGEFSTFSGCTSACELENIK